MMEQFYNGDWILLNIITKYFFLLLFWCSTSIRVLYCETYYKNLIKTLCLGAPYISVDRCQFRQGSAGVHIWDHAQPACTRCSWQCSQRRSPESVQSASNPILQILKNLLDWCKSLDCTDYWPVSCWEVFHIARQYLSPEYRV